MLSSIGHSPLHLRREIFISNLLLTCKSEFLNDIHITIDGRGSGLLRKRGFSMGLVQDSIGEAPSGNRFGCSTRSFGPVGKKGLSNVRQILSGSSHLYSRV